MAGDLTRLVRERLNELVDEETDRKFGELNIISEVTESSAGDIKVKFTPFSPYSPTAVGTARLIKNASLSVEGVKSVSVECGGHMMDDLVNRLANKEEKKQR